MDAIEKWRRERDISEWKQFCASDAGLDSWRRFLLNDPYTAHGFNKPRGYPGDASLMDFAYNHASVAEKIAQASDIGRAIYAVTSNAEQSLSARRRVDLAAQVIREAVENRGKLRLASFAAGHARELERVMHLAAAIESFHAVDSDAVSLAEIDRCYSPRINLHPVAKSVFRLEEDELPRVDLAYSLGLFDYLTDVAAQRALRTISRSVQAGGTLLVGNLSLSAANLGYCEGVMDWWMLPRSARDMEQLGESLGPRNAWRFDVVEEGCFLYLRADRLARDD